MATFNRAHLIIYTLNSIKNQTYQSFECLIIDDGGQDHTKTVVEEFISEDKRFSYAVRPDKYKKGLPGCRNYGLDICNGDYVIFFDDDDLVHPENLNFCFNQINKFKLDFVKYNFLNFRSSYNVIFKEIDYFELEIINHDSLEKIIKREINLISCSIMFRKHILREHRFNEQICFAEELEFFVRILLHSNFRGGVTSNNLYFARKQKDSMTGDFLSGKSESLQCYSFSIAETINNLKSKKRLTFSLKKYLLNEIFMHADKVTFNNVLISLAGNDFQRSFWQFYFFIYPLRLIFFKLKLKKMIARIISLVSIPGLLKLFTFINCFALLESIITLF